MAVSPADFEFYSRVTGIPIPNDPVARMRMAPQVYAMRRSPMSKLGSFAKGAAKALGTAALLGGAAAIGGAIGGAGGGAVGGAVGGAGGGFAGGFTGSQYGNEYEPEQSSTPEEPVETVKVEVDAAPTPSARDKAESFVESVTHGFKQDSGEELVGRAATPEEVAAFRQRISHQTEVPQADPNLANESFDAQRASVGEPVESLTTGFPAQTAPGVETAVAQAVEFFEGSPGKSPFQAGGAMNELGRQSRQVKQTVGDLPEGIRGDVARFISNLGSAPSESAVSAPAQSEAQEFRQQLGRMSERDQVQYQGGLAGGKPQGIHGAYEHTADAINDPPLGGSDIIDKARMKEMIDRSNVLPNALEIMNNIRSAPAPTPEDPLTGDYRAFVSDKGVEIGNLLKQSQEKKSAPAMDPRRQEITDTIRKYRANLPRAEQDALIDKLYGMTDKGDRF